MSTKNKISWRHHYLPKFYIKNFFKKDNKIWVFNKDKNKIEKKPYSPKTIFFEHDRNILELDGQRTDFLEDLYGKFDNKLAEKFNLINSNTRDQLENDNEFILILYTFINWLYWRIPTFDKLNGNYINENIEYLKQFGEEKYPKVFSSLSDESKLRLYRGIIPFEILQKPFNTNEEFFKFKIYEYKDPIFLLADNPLIIKKYPGSENIISNPVIIPISANKLYFTLERDEYLVSDDIVKQLNFILMYNAEKYVASPNKKLLEGFVRGYEEIRKIQNIDILVEDLFDKINKKENGN